MDKTSISAPNRASQEIKRGYTESSNKKARTEAGGGICPGLTTIKTCQEANYG